MCLGLANGGYIPPKEDKKTSLLKAYTNNDRINDMSIEEKAKLLSEMFAKCHLCIYRNQNRSCAGKTCEDGIKKYLESEAE